MGGVQTGLAGIVVMLRVGGLLGRLERCLRGLVVALGLGFDRLGLLEVGLRLGEDRLGLVERVLCFLDLGLRGLDGFRVLRVALGLVEA